VTPSRRGRRRNGIAALAAVTLALVLVGVAAN